MSLQIKIAISFTNNQVVVNDITGNYNATTNPTGYGAPNPAFSAYAHYLILRKKNVNQVADVVLTLDNYDPTTATQWTANRTIDGWYEADNLNISKWTAGTYNPQQVAWYNGAVYQANVQTTSIPGVDSTWTIVTDLTSIEGNASVVQAMDGRVTVYNADTYWSKQIAINSQRGKCALFDDDKKRLRMDKIEFHINAGLVADQLGDNENGEWNVQALILLNAQ